MAGQRSTLTQLVTEIRRLRGAPTAALDEDFANADTGLYAVINRYITRLPARVADIVRGEGISIGEGPLHFPMWRDVWESTIVNAADTLVTAAGSSTVYLPSNLDAIESLYDKTHKRPLWPVSEVNRWTRSVQRLKTKPAGPAEAYEISGYTTNTYWVRVATLLPSTAAGVTPSLTLSGWRIPAAMAGSSPGTEYPDIDTKYEQLVIVGVAREVALPDDPSYQRCTDREKELALELATTAEIT